MGKFAVIRKKESWSTTWLGKFLILLIFFLIILLAVRNIHSFLAQNDPFTDSEIMIVEGFLPDFAIKEAMKIFETGNYKMMIVTGKKMDKGALLFPYQNDGQYTAAILEKLGFDPQKIRIVGLEKDVSKDRTWTSAVAVAQWINKEGIEVQNINLVSLSCHSRRSRYLFEKAFGHKIQFGIIAIQNIGYDASAWWRSSYGFKEVIEETLAWFYVRFFFSPKE